MPATPDELVEIVYVKKLLQQAMARAEVPRQGFLFLQGRELKRRSLRKTVSDFKAEGRSTVEERRVMADQNSREEARC